jgi:hypothetical protein
MALGGKVFPARTHECGKHSYMICAAGKGDNHKEAASVQRRQLLSGTAALVLGCSCAACAAKAAAVGQQSSWYQKYFAWAMANEMVGGGVPDTY